MAPGSRPPHRLAPLGGAGRPAGREQGRGKITSHAKELLLAKYGDLTAARPGSALVAPQIRDAAELLGERGEQLAASPAHRGSQDDAPYVTRREFEDRMSQMEQRIALLASALRQQDELSARMSAALDEVLAKTAALPLPRAAPAGLMGIAHDGSAAVDAGGMVVPDPTLGGGGGGVAGAVGGGGGGVPGGGLSFGGHGVPLGGGLVPGGHMGMGGVVDPHGHDECAAEGPIEPLACGGLGAPP